MSNHDGSYMLNEVIRTMMDEGIEEQIGRDAFIKLIKKIIEIGRHHDCNNGEILEDLEHLKLCYLCLHESDVLIDGVCPTCDKKFS
ncbi:MULTISPECIES: hypothetical protein [Alicyclobacillus]|uniref:Uncharacterized protein n=1 Tax=Alicyclobacillus acidocaldarius subsp. acidocaldarius (strain ATCC 27009 / DSM 446 / BCRC 14685 / JCM 5260 / KCTC 1825 / NBRC 15652 / NCIMB 11725 / NRRL B-14509 / 104-IA) TaxID=521098 RepID=C8WY64_ALIAD|nr:MULTISPECIES: hypothetical protein [Alicyclobacillus]ACV59958.1 hypothetical protein Aaci_2955 [Alicyclobacillus acidocaldarius subsp. acidocaldarius DSM 446]